MNASGSKELVLAYMAELTRVGQCVLAGVALSLGLDARYFADGYTADPTVLFRIFSYPPAPPDAVGWGVGEHTDYGLLTLLAQDDSGGLQVATPDGWMDAPPLPGTFVCNIGDMLDRLTGGWYRSTPHRVRNLSGRARLSFPFFLDPGFADEVPPLPGRATAHDAAIDDAVIQDTVIQDPPPKALAGAAGTGRTCARSAALTATTCWARYRRSSRSSGRTYSTRADRAKTGSAGWTKTGNTEGRRAPWPLDSVSGWKPRHRNCTG